MAVRERDDEVGMQVDNRVWHCDQRTVLLLCERGDGALDLGGVAHADGRQLYSE